MAALTIVGRSVDVRSVLGRVAPWAFTTVIGYLVLVPLIKLQQLAIKDGAKGYRDAYGAEDFFEVLRMTLFLAIGSLAIAMVLGTALAWAATRLPRRVRFLAMVPILPIILPAAANVTGWAFLLSPRPGYLNALLRMLPWWRGLEEGPIDIYTMPWIVIITGFSLTAFVYLFVSSGIRNVSMDLIEAAQVGGASMLRSFFAITLPLLRPALVYGGGVVLLLGLGQFTGPLLLGRNAGVEVLTTEMYRAVSQSPINYGAAAGIGSPLLLVGIAVIIGQKVMLGNQQRFVTHGSKSSFRSQARPSWASAAFISVFGLLSTVFPMGALAIVSMGQYWSGKFEPSRWTAENYRTAWGSSAVRGAVTMSVTSAVIAVFIALPLGFMASRIILRGKGWVRTAVDYLVAVPLGVPAVIFGLGFLLTYTQEPFILYGTRWVLVLVYVTLMLPFATRMQISGMLALGTAYEEAARVSGAGALTTILRIQLPLLRSTLAGAGALIFVLLTHEFTASMLVRTPATQVMGTVLYDYWSNGIFAMVATMALTMALVTFLGVVTAFALGGSDVLSKL